PGWACATGASTATAATSQRFPRPMIPRPPIVPPASSPPVPASRWAQLTPKRLASQTAARRLPPPRFAAVPDAALGRARATPRHAPPDSHRYRGAPRRCDAQAPATSADRHVCKVTAPRTRVERGFSGRFTPDAALGRVRATPLVPPAAARPRPSPTPTNPQGVDAGQGGGGTRRSLSRCAGDGRASGGPSPGARKRKKATRNEHGPLPPRPRRHPGADRYPAFAVTGRRPRERRTDQPGHRRHRQPDQVPPGRRGPGAVPAAGPLGTARAGVPQRALPGGDAGAGRGLRPVRGALAGAVAAAGRPGRVPPRRQHGTAGAVRPPAPRGPGALSGRQRDLNAAHRPVP